jgi:hypothetical protein
MAEKRPDLNVCTSQTMLRWVQRAHDEEGPDGVVGIVGEQHVHGIVALQDVFLFVDEDVQSFIPVLRAGFRSMERFPGFPMSERTYQDFQSG